MDDLDRSKHDGWPYYFNREVADRQIALVMSFRHTQDVFQGKYFNLQSWQAFINASKWGWLKKKNHYRRFRRSYIEVPRKNGKSEMGGADMVYALIFDGTKGGEVYSVAVEKQQAFKSYDSARIMINQLRHESQWVRSVVYEPTIMGIKTVNESKMKVISRDKKGSMDSLNISYCNVDEVHSHQSHDTLYAAESSTGSRPQPMISCITTAGYNKHGICYQRRGMLIRILSGELVDDEQFGVIYTIDDEDDWESPECWQKANPNWNVSLFPDGFESDYVKARNEGTFAEIEFKTKRLNIWTNTSSTWIPDRIITSQTLQYTLEDLAGRRCYGGLDLAYTYDLTVLSLFFPSDVAGEPHKTLQLYWIPEDNMRERCERDGVNYMEWCEKGWISATPGNVTDYDYIEKTCMELLDKINIVEIAYDQHFSAPLVIRLTEAGFHMRPHSMGPLAMSTPTKEIERMYRAAEIANNGNPVTRWCYGNVTLRIDSYGNITPDKGKSVEKIDGAVADIIAFSQYKKAELDPQDTPTIGVHMRKD